MSDDILRCPFCGGHAELLSEGCILWSVVCSNCGAASGYSDEDGAVRLWNRRVWVADPAVKTAWNMNVKVVEPWDA